MKRFLTFGLLLTLLALSAFIVTPSRAHAQGAGLVSSILNRMERNRRGLTSLRAGIIMTKYNSQIGENDNSAGTVIYKPGRGRNSYVRVDWERPQHETLAVANGRYTLFRPHLNVAYVGDANSNRNKVSNVLGFGLDVSRQQLAAHFQPPEYLGEDTLDGGVSTWHLKLVPKGGASYRYSEIWVDQTGMTVQVKIVEKNDDSTTVRLTDVEKNARLSDNEFILKLPPDVKRVRG